MAETQYINPDVLTHSVPVPSEVETAECSSSHPNVETGNASPELDIDKDIDDLFKAAVEGKIDDFKKHEKHLVQLVTPNKNTILHIHITARPLDFVEGIPKLIHKLFPLLRDTELSAKKRSLDFVIKGIHKLTDKLFPKAQKKAQSKKESSLDFVEKILEMCSDLLWKVNILEETLLHIAARHGHDDIVEFLLKKSKETHHNDQEKGVGEARQMLRMTNKAKDTALHEAVRFNHIDVVKRLIKEDSDYSYGANAAGETPLYLAVERGYHNIVITMAPSIFMILQALGLKLGLKFESSGLHEAWSSSSGPKGRTALHAAVLRNDCVITWVILAEERTLAEKKDERGWIPLHYAAYYGYINVAELLLLVDKSTAYIKTGKEENMTRNEEMTDIKTDDDKKTALHIAASHGNVDMMKVIISRCPGCSELVDERGWNVLHFAMESRNPKAIKLLLENPSLGNLINEYNGDGNTPLHQLAALGFNMPSFIGHPKVDKQAFNEQQLNALDITSGKDEFSKEQKRLKYCLKNNGIKKGQRVDINKGEGEEPSSDDGKGKNKDDGNVLVATIIKEAIEAVNKDGKRKNKDDSDIKEAREHHLVVATLIATVTFAAGFTLPGGYKDEGNADQGTAILTRSAAFKAFVITDTIAMMLSSSAVFLHLFMALDRDKERILKQFINELQLIIWALYAMVVAFITGTYAVLAPSLGLAIAACVLGGIFCLLSVYFIMEYIFDLIDSFHNKIRSLSLQSSTDELQKVLPKKQVKKSKPS